MSPKITIIDYSIYTRPESGMEFPETPVGFFEFFLTRMRELLAYSKFDSAAIEAAKAEALRILDVASDIYRLRVGRDFWDVLFEWTDGGHGLAITFRPRSLSGYTVRIENLECGGYKAEAGGLFVVGDSALEALTGLGRLMERRGSYPLPIYRTATCTCGTGRGCLIH